MRILVIANNPENIGGVMNYTRPLALEFHKMGNDVYYLYSGAWDSQYNLLIKPYIRKKYNTFPFECAEIVNSTCLSYNYGEPELDNSDKRMEAVITKYLDNIKPDVIHIHSRVGLPSSINKIAFDKNIIVVNTIHTYGYICQKRVMIDYDGNSCSGPTDLHKCAICTGTINYRKERIKLLFIRSKLILNNTAPLLFNMLRTHKSKASKPTIALVEKVSSCRIELSETEQLLANRLKARLDYCIDSLNRYSDCTLCVSNDVKTTLTRHGVNESRLLVQHIGSTIAEKQTVNNQNINMPIIIGNIGGVNHYKGIHVLVDAANQVKGHDYKIIIFGKYDEQYVSGFRSKLVKVPIEFTGRYKPEDLPEILKKIDIMVLPSICNDTAPQTIFESFSGGVPIIASNIGGFPDFVEHDKNGLLFEAGNSADLAQKIDYVLSNPDRIGDYKNNIPKLKTISENATELISLYSELRSSRSLNHAA